MALGGASSWSLSVAWDGVTFVDESVYLDALEGVVIKRGRGSAADDVQPGTLEGVWRQDEVGALGRHITDNALSPLYPNVRDGKLCRFSIIRGASNTWRHRGRITLTAPKWPNGSAAGAVVPFLSVGKLGDLMAQELRGDFLERWVDTAETTSCDVWDYPDVKVPSTFTNLGSAAGVGRVLQSTGRVGSAKVASADGIDTGNVLELVPSNAVGPVAQYTTGVAAGSVQKLIVPFRTADRTAAGGASKYIAVGYDAAGSVLFSVRLVDNVGQTDLNLYDASGTFLSTLYFGFAPSGDGDADDQWFTLLFNGSGASTQVFLLRTVDFTSLAGPTVAVDIRNLRTLVAGGLSSRSLIGRNSACIACQVGPVVITAGGGSHTSYLQQGDLTTWGTRLVDLNLYGNFPSATTGTRNDPVARESLVGENLFNYMAKLHRVGSLVYESRSTDGTLLFRDVDTQRLPTVAVTLDAALDLDSDDFDWRVGEQPSSVKARWYGGEETYTDGTRPFAQASVETPAASAAQARSIGSYRALSWLGRRLERLRVDLASASNDLWAAMMALEIGDRIRVTLGTGTTSADATPLVAQLGVRYVDLYVVQIEERYARDVAEFILVTVPADEPVEGVWDDATRGRWAADGFTISGGTAISGTGTGTVIVNVAGTSGFTTSAGEYPLQLDLNGECVTIGSAPSAPSAGLQTLTITARGVNETLARAHVAGEPVDVWLAACWTL